MLYRHKIFEYGGNLVFGNELTQLPNRLHCQTFNIILQDAFSVFIVSQNQESLQTRNQ